MIQLALVDDHKILRDGIKLSLLGNNNVHLALETSSAEEFLKAYKQYTLDIIILDNGLPGMSGTALAKILLEEDPNSKIIMLSAMTDENSILHAVKSGVKSYLSKDVGAQELMEAIYSVNTGEEYFGGKISKIIYSSYVQINKSQNSRDKKKTLSARETEVLRCFANGLTYKQTGEKLFISPRTVEAHKNSILNKLELFTLADLIKYAIKNGIIEL